MHDLRELIRERPIVVPLAVTVVGVLALVGLAVAGSGSSTGDDIAADGDLSVAVDDADPTVGTAGPATTTSTTEAPLPPFDGWVNPASSMRPWGDTVEGLLTFRGNPTRSWYGRGPVPTNPVILWSYPGESGGLCGTSIDGSGAQTWCGTGWTGQPSVWEWDDRTWVAFGAYDYAVHWVDAVTGEDLLAPFATGDIIKGSVTVDPDGYPLLYTGSRDSFFRVIAMDRGEPVELWKISSEAVYPTKWNNDWDGSALVIDDHLFEGGENSQFHIVKLNRGYDADGLVTVDPELVFNTPGWDDEQLAEITDGQVSIENSVAISGNTVYFANSGGLVQGWDIEGLTEGVTPTRTFRFWTGDDTDASIVIDEEGFLYVASEYERHNARSTEVGQLMKLDPTKPEDPLVWSIKDQTGGKSGAWGTPAITEDVVYADFNSGRVLAARRDTGEILWEKDLSGPTWQSPVVVDDRLIIGDCEGNLRAYDVSDPFVEPPELWSVQLTGCIESTPAVWDGRIFVGARGGRFYAIGDPELAPPGGPETSTADQRVGEDGAPTDGSATVTTERPVVSPPGG